MAEQQVFRPDGAPQDIDFSVPAGREKPWIFRTGVGILGAGVIALGIHVLFQAANLPECTVDGDAGVTLAGNQQPSGHLGETLHLSTDGSQVGYGYSNVQPFCNVVTPEQSFAEAAAEDAPLVDLTRVAIRHPDGSLDILNAATGDYDLTIGELHDHGDTASYLAEDINGEERMFVADVELGTDWKPLSELRPARTPGRELVANEI